MSLNIKNERVHQLAREAAQRTGKTQTGVIEEALRQYLDGVTRTGTVERRREAVNMAVAAFDTFLTAEDRERMRNHADWLYDERGLPT